MPHLFRRDLIRLLQWKSTFRIGNTKRSSVPRYTKDEMKVKKWKPLQGMIVRLKRWDKRRHTELRRPHSTEYKKTRTIYKCLLAVPNKSRKRLTLVMFNDELWWFLSAPLSEMPDGSTTSWVEKVVITHVWWPSFKSIWKYNYGENISLLNIKY